MPVPKGVRRRARVGATWTSSRRGSGGKQRKKPYLSPTEKKMLECSVESRSGTRPSDILQELLKQPRWKNHRPDQVMKFIKKCAGPSVGRKKAKPTPQKSDSDKSTQSADLAEDLKTDDSSDVSQTKSTVTATVSHSSAAASNVTATGTRERVSLRGDLKMKRAVSQREKGKSKKKRQFSEMSEESSDDIATAGDWRSSDRRSVSEELATDSSALTSSISSSNGFVFGDRAKATAKSLAAAETRRFPSAKKKKKPFTDKKKSDKGKSKEAKRTQPLRGKGRGKDRRAAQSFDYFRHKRQKETEVRRKRQFEDSAKRKAVQQMLNGQPQAAAGADGMGAPKASVFGTGAAAGVGNQQQQHQFEVVFPTETLAQMGGISALSDTIDTLRISICNQSLWQTLGTAPPRSILLHGPPGCGKSMFARCLAGDCQTALISVSAPELISGMSGGSEARIRSLFQTALANAPCVVFMDEIDVIASKREDASKAMEQRIVAQLLTCLDAVTKEALEKAVLFIAATNRPDSIDNALRRADRFDKELALGIPNEAERREILLKLTDSVKLAADIQFEKLAEQTAGFVAADLKALVKEAGVIAAKRILIAKDLRDGKETSVDETRVSEDGKYASDGGDVKDVEMHGADDDDSSSDFELESLKKRHKHKLAEESHADGVDLGDFRFTADGGDHNDDDDNSESEEYNGAEEYRGLNTEVRMADFSEALPNVQPSARREGFATIPDVGWEDIGGDSCEAVKAVMERELIGRIRAETRALYKMLKVDCAAGVLLYGPPGCGKTLIAKAVARESGASFIAIKGPELLNKYVGESEKAIRTVFARARSSQPCVVFFDELDSIAPRRDGADSGEGSNVTQRIVNQLLTELDGVNERGEVFVIGATNRADIIDPALTRPGRLGRKVYIPLPLTAASRVSILKKHLGDVNFDEDLLQTVALDKRCARFSGADLAELVKEASLNLIDDCRVTMLSTATATATATQSEEATGDGPAVIDKSLLKLEKRHFDKALETVKASVSKAEESKYDLFHAVLNE